MKIALGSDHGGFELKQAVIEHLKERGTEYKDFGCYDKSSCDYPVYGRAAAKAVASGEFDRGIVICTTGIEGTRLLPARAALLLPLHARARDDRLLRRLLRGLRRRLGA